MKNLFISTVLIYMISIHSVSISAELVKNKINEFSNETALAISNFAKIILKDTVIMIFYLFFEPKVYIF